MKIKYFIEKERLNCLTRQWSSATKPYSQVDFYPDMVSLCEQIPSLTSVLQFNERLNILSVDDDGFIEYYFCIYKDNDLVSRFDNFNSICRGE